MEKFYFTLSGLKAVKEEREILLQLKKQKGKLPELLHSEEVNPEYLAYVEDTDLLNVKLADLDYIIKHAELIKEPSKEKQNVVDLGAKVSLASSQGDNEFEIVNTFEADPTKGKISIKSPIGKSLLGHKTGEEVSLPNLHKKYKIRKVSYHHLS